MPSAEKQKKQKSPSRKARGVQGRATYRSEGHSDLLIESFLKGRKPELFLATVVGKRGGAARFDLEDEKGGKYDSVGIKGNLRITRKASQNPAVKTAIDLESHVLTDGGQIYAVLSADQTSYIRQKKLGKIVKDTGRNSSLDSLFNRESPKNWHLAEKAATRKAQHKQTRRSRSRSGSLSLLNEIGSVVSGSPPRSASPSSAPGSGERMGRYIFKGKKVFSVSGREIHGEEKREAKRALEMKKKAATAKKA